MLNLFMKNVKITIYTYKIQIAHIKIMLKAIFKCKFCQNNNRNVVLAKSMHIGKKHTYIYIYLFENS